MQIVATTIIKRSLYRPARAQQRHAWSWTAEDAGGDPSSQHRLLSPIPSDWNTELSEVERERRTRAGEGKREKVSPRLKMKEYSRNDSAPTGIELDFMA